MTSNHSSSSPLIQQALDRIDRIAKELVDDLNLEDDHSAATFLKALRRDGEKVLPEAVNTVTLEKVLSMEDDARFLQALGYLILSGSAVLAQSKTTPIPITPADEEILH